MADDALKNLQHYMIQLEQVEAALLTDPNNEELKKLQSDLQEVIALTKNLPELVDSRLPAPSEEQSDESLSTPLKQWRIGDRCSYDGIIDAITDDGLVAVTFEKYGNSTVAKIGTLKEPKGNQSYPSAGQSSEKEKEKARQTEQQRLMAKKKKQKKFDRQKMIEEAHEADKAKWQAFTTKYGKTKKLRGLTKKSIFATPEAANGRVGIGTCGIGGKPMTEYTHAEKWRKGT
ncbi:Survival of motor neuron-related-splicing factor 30 [Armadillidium nasatum]|uniref:Survival of motor neuron-related-splicing factor 30 n=1 Tax=Armadillidium nasatum TaxID=96803 RepID=A0A5N5SHH7_9CRUS|nr:Survival of motor neuron-related-splicing factor 30 [Armadillidium nasatum]